MLPWKPTDQIELFDFLNSMSNKARDVLSEMDQEAQRRMSMQDRHEQSKIRFLMADICSLPKLSTARAHVKKMEAEGYVFERKTNNTTKPYVFSLRDVHAIYKYIGEPSHTEKRTSVGVCVAVPNLKGGTGKSTATINIGTGLVYERSLIRHRLKICIIDLDPQGSLSRGIGTNSVRNQSAFRAIVDTPSKEQLRSWLQPTKSEGLFVLPSNTSDAFLIREFASIAAGRGVSVTSMLYDNVIRHLEDEFDLILLDVAPHLDEVMLNILSCCHGMLVSTSPDLIDIDSTAKFIEGLPALFLPLDKTRLRPECFKFLFTRFDKNNDFHKEIHSFLLETFPRQLFGSFIPYGAPFKTSQITKESIYEIPFNDYDGGRQTIVNAVSAMNNVVQEFYKTFLNVDRN